MNTAAAGPHSAMGCIQAWCSASQRQEAMPLSRGAEHCGDQADTTNGTPSAVPTQRRHRGPDAKSVQ